jgi:phage tail sheath gpL-like
MKASELIYRLAKAIEARGDLPVTVAVDGYAAQQGNNVISGEAMSLDVNTSTYGFEIYGEEQ